MMTSMLRTVATALALGLVGCGGGGGGGTHMLGTYTIGGAVAGLATGESVTLANGADSLTVSSNATFVFGTAIQQNGSYSVTVKTQPAGQNCSVSAGSGSGLTANVTGVAIACTNLAQYAYVVNNGNNSVSQFTIDASGMLAPLSVASVATGNSPQSVTVDPTHSYVYVTNLIDDTVSQYVIQKDGTLAPNTPATVGTGHAPWALAVSPSGDWAYVVNSTDGTISQYSVSSSGALAAAGVAPVATGLGPWNVTLSPNGKYVYVSNHGTLTTPSMSLSQYSIGASNGAITPLNPASLLSEANFPGGITVDANSAYAYVANISSNSVSQYAIGADGTLTSLSPAFVVTGTEPVYLAIDPSNRYAYVANYTVDVNPALPGTVSQFTVGASGQLTPMPTPTVAAGIGPGWIAFDSFGHYAYVVNLGNGTAPGTVSEYAIGTDGALTLVGTVSAGPSAFMIATTF
jgi:6-phosphogluconolactonase (cycloisomerase 2 family)